VALLCGASVLVAARARADTSPQERAAAQALFDEARRLMAEHRYPEACPKLEESERLEPGVGTRFNLAVCYEGVGRNASAWSLFLEVAASARQAAERAREQAARARAAAIEPKLPRLRIVVPEPARARGLRITRGDADVGPAQWGSAVPTDPGTYAITATAPGKQPWRVDVAAPPNGETHTVSIAPLADETPAAVAPSSEPAPRASARRPVDDESLPSSLGTQRVAGLALGAGAIAALGVGSVFGIMAIDGNAASNQRCRGNLCNAAGYAQRRDARANGDRATVAFIAGSALAGAAIALYVTGGQPRESAARTLAFAPSLLPAGTVLCARGRF
jgi:hypothetical protein